MPQAHGTPSVCLQKGDQGCANCGDVPEAPVVAACAHVFCKQCLDLQVSVGRRCIPCQLSAMPGPAGQLKLLLCARGHLWEQVPAVASAGVVCAPPSCHLGPGKGSAQSLGGAASCLSVQAVNPTKLWQKCIMQPGAAHLLAPPVAP